MGQKNRTSQNSMMEKEHGCPAENLLKSLPGKWKPRIFRLALDGPLRFNTLLRQLEGSNKQSIAAALKEMEGQDLLKRSVVRQRPLHVEYRLSEKGRSLIPVFQLLETLA